MTARPIVPKIRRSQVCSAVGLLLVMVAVLLAAGCIGCVLLPTGCIQSNYITDEDIVAIKLNSDGSTEWMKTIDSGKSDFVKKIIQTSDEGYALAGSYSTPLCHSPGPVTPTVIRLSDTGEILWRKDYDLGLGGLPPYASDQIAGIVQSPVTGYYLISSYGGIIRLDSQGNTFWRKNLSSGDPDIVFVNYPLQNTDGSIVIGGSVGNCSINSETLYCSADTTQRKPFITKLDRDGNQVWFTKIPYSDYLTLKSIIKLSANNGYIGHITSDSGIRPLFKVDETGHLINSDPINSIRNVFQIESRPDGFSVFSVNQSIHWNSMNRTFIESSYTNEGNLTKTINLLNIIQREAPSDRDMTIVTSDGNYFYVHLIGTIVHVQKVNHEDEQIWDRQVTSFKTSNNLVHIRDVINTKDNGYLIILGVEKQKEC